MFYYEIPWIYQDFKIENLFSCGENTRPVTRGHVKSSQMWSETPLKL